MKNKINTEPTLHTQPKLIINGCNSEYYYDNYGWHINVHVNEIY